MQVKVLNQEDFDNNPGLRDRGLEVGQKVEIPDEGTIADAQAYVGNDDRDQGDSASDTPKDEGDGQPADTKADGE